VFEDAVDASASRAFAEADAKFGEIGWSAGCNDLNVAVFGVADPTGQAEFAGLAVDEPAEAYTLNATLYEKMKHHGL